MNDKIACYTFLPWTRRGIANSIQETDVLGGSVGNSERASVSVGVRVNRTTVSGQSDHEDVDKTFELLGPGDIVGIEPSIVVRTEPANGITNFEPNYLPYIEFYEEDFLWRYTPAAPNGHRLRPWLFLLVLEEGAEFEFNEFSALSSPLPSITIPAGPEDAALFPKENQGWAWAHVHVNQILDDAAGSDEGAKLQSIVDNDPNLACCRLLSPRKLSPQKRYHAFLVPAYEKGRLAGLGAEKSLIDAADAQRYSWGFAHANHPNQWPYFYTWSFMTGENGDFEELVRRLKPRQLDRRVGRRPLDIQSPGYALRYTGTTDGMDGAIYLEGALRIPGNDTSNFAASNAQANRAFVEQVQHLLNLEDHLRKDDLPASNPYNDNPHYTNDAGRPTSTIADDPIITPPIYGKWHALVDRVNRQRRSRWVNHLNLDPQQRTIAGFGTKVVQQNQEKYMDLAWDQFGQIVEANRKLRLGQLSEQLSVNLYRRHVVEQRTDRLLQFTQRLHTRIRLRRQTVDTFIRESAIPIAAVQPAFVKLARPGGHFHLMEASPIQVEQSVIQLTANRGATAAVQYDEIVAEADFSVTGLHTAVNIQLGTTPTPAAPQPGHVLSQLSTRSLASIPAQNMTAALQPFQAYFATTNWQLEAAKPAVSVASLSGDIIEKLHPAQHVRRRVLTALRGALVEEKETIVPIMAAPKISLAMYKPLVAISNDLLIPNLHLIPNDTISLLESNQAFIESYMVGLNHEFARELLWREFPTDQRGSYFRQFWEVKDKRRVDTSVSQADFEESTKDITEIHTWTSTSRLGSHRPDDHDFKLEKRRSDVTNEDENKLVLVVRGELLKKYPNTIIYIQAAQWQQGAGGPQKHLPRTLNTDAPILYPIFQARIHPDLNFMGFDLTASEAKGDPDVNDKPGYFIVLKERSGEIHFGMDINQAPPGEGGNSWNSLSWADLPDDMAFIDLAETPSGLSTRENVTWDDASSNAADMAFILYQNPYMVAIHAKEMLPKTI